jgi:very-short-patch-repair endonuclease
VADLPPVFIGSAAVHEGKLTPKQLRGPQVRRILRGVYSPAGVTVTHEILCEGAGLLLPTTAQITGRSRAAVAGIHLASAEDPVEVLVSEHERFGPYRGLAVRRVVDMPSSGETWRGTRLASWHRTAFDLAARHPLADGVAHLDRVAAAGYVDLVALGRWLEDQHGQNVVAVRRAVALADSRSESIPESIVRVTLVEDGLAVVPQHEIRHMGRFVARADLAIPDLRIAIEYDGAWHALREQLQRDRDRLNRLHAAGWTVVHITADMLRRPHAIIGAVHAAIAAQRAGRRTA